MKREHLNSAIVFGSLVTLAVLVRLLTEVPNFSAVAATALFVGFYFRSRMTALCVPLVAMTISDYFLGGYSKGVMLAVYASLIMPIAWRGVLRNHLGVVNVASAAVASTMAHFLLTNAAVWYAWYPHTSAGLSRCYAVAVPFLARQLVCDLLFPGRFFGLYVALHALGRQRAAQPATLAA